MKKMKKLLLCVLLIASAMTYTNAQPAAPAPTDAAKWSFALKGGVDYFRVTPMSTKSDNQFINDASWGLGASIERTVNPLIGYGISFDWLNFNRNTVSGKTLDPLNSVPFYSKFKSFLRYAYHHSNRNYFILTC